MEQFEKAIKEYNLRQKLNIETGFDEPVEIVKSRSGIYRPTKENLKQGRAGERYGNMINGGSTQDLEGGKGVLDVGSLLQHDRTKSLFEVTKISGSEIVMRTLTSGSVPGLKVGSVNRTSKNLIGKTYSRVNEVSKKSNPDFKEESSKTRSDPHFKEAFDSYANKKEEVPQKSLDRVKSIIKQYEGKDSDFIDGMVVNMCQNLSNKQIAAAYKILGVHDKMSRTESVKRANKKPKEVQKSIETILKAFDNDLLSKDIFEKGFGKKAQLGETREWHGVRMKKVSETGDSKKDWQPVKEDKGPEKKEEKVDLNDTPSEDVLTEHAKNSSEAALSAAIKESSDPKVRQIAHAELQRRSKEEKPQEEKETFPRKTGEMPGEQKKEEKKSEPKEKSDTDQLKKKHDLLAKHRNELEGHEKKKGQNYQERTRANEELRAKQTKERRETMSSDKTNNMDSLKKLDGKHDKEWNDHLKKHDDVDKKWKDEHKQLLDKHSKEKEGLNPKTESEKITDPKIYNEIKTLDIGDVTNGVSKDQKKVFEIKSKKDGIITLKSEDGNIIEVSEKEESKSSSLEYDKMSDKELSQAFQDLRLHKVASSTEKWQDNIKKVKDELEKRKSIKKSIQGIRYF